MNPSESIRRILKNIPEEFFEIWLNPIVKKYGFPFQSVNENIHDTIWWEYFGHCTLKTFSELSWVRENFRPRDLKIKESCVTIIGTIVHFYQTNEWTYGVNLPNSKDRVIFHKEFIQNNDKFYAPIVLLPTTEGAMVLDGSHRLAAFYLSETEKMTIDAWVGVPPKA